MSSNNQSMKRHSKLDRLPQPIALAARKPSLKNTMEMQPYKVDWDSPKLRQIENNCPLSSASLISNMKQELSSIKLDVYRLISSYEPLEAKLTQKMDIFNQSLKDELAYQKKVEYQLRKELRYLKMKLSDPKPREYRLAYERKLYELKADKFKSDREKYVFQYRIAKLQGYLQEAQKLSQTKEEVKCGKIQQLTRYVEKLQSDKKKLATYCLRLQEESEKPTDDKSIQCNMSHNEMMQLRNNIHDLEKEKLALIARLREKYDDMAYVTYKFQAALKYTEGKYYNSIAEFKNIESQLAKTTTEEVVVLNDRLKQLYEQLYEMTRANQQLQKYKKYWTTKTKTKDKPMVDNAQLEAIKKYHQVMIDQAKEYNIELLNRNSELLTKVETLYNDMMDIQKVDIEALKYKIEELYSGMQNMQQSYERKLKDSDEIVANIKQKYLELSAETNIYKAEADAEIMDLRSKVHENAQKTTIERSTQTANKKPIQLESMCQTQPIEKVYRYDAYAQINEPSDNQYSANLRIHCVNMYIYINRLHSYMIRITEELKSTEDLSRDKDAYIHELEKQKEIMYNNEHFSDMEAKYRQMYEEQTKLLEYYELKIMKLENYLEETKERHLRSSRMSRTSNTTKDSTAFDEALKCQITENYHLRVILKQKQEELLEAKSQLEDWRRKAEALKSQTEIDKIRGVSEERTMKSHFYITIQNLKNDIDSQKRKYETMQRKIDFKTEELKKKDDFIQQVIVGRIGKDERTPYFEYMKKEIYRFFSYNYEARLFSAQERIRELYQQSA